LVLFGQALAIDEQVLGADNTRTNIDRARVSLELSELGRDEEALAIANDALARQEATGRHDRVEQMLRYVVASELVRNGQDRAARWQLEKSLAMAERLLGPEHPNVLPPLRSLAELATREHRFKEAKLAWKRVAAIEAKTGAKEETTRL